MGREFYSYYRTPRVQHPNSTTEKTMTSDFSFMNFPLLTYIKSISLRPILFITGEHAHSRYFSEDAYNLAAEPKELYIIAGVGHVVLYDRTELIPYWQINLILHRTLEEG